MKIKTLGGRWKADTRPSTSSSKETEPFRKSQTVSHRESPKVSEHATKCPRKSSPDVEKARQRFTLFVGACRVEASGMEEDYEGDTIAPGKAAPSCPMTKKSPDLVSWPRRGGRRAQWMKCSRALVDIEATNNAPCGPIEVHAGASLSFDGSA